MGSSCFLVCLPPENQSIYSIESIEVHIIQWNWATMASQGKNPFLAWKPSPSWNPLACWQHCSVDISSAFGESEHCYLEHFFPKAATWHVITLETRYIPSSSYKWDTDKGDNDLILRAWVRFHSSVILIKITVFVFYKKQKWQMWSYKSIFISINTTDCSTEHFWVTAFLDSG